jgi:hypothetical protein
MSAAAYRIDTEHESYSGQWWARVVRLSDDFPVYSASAITERHALERATGWIAAEYAKQDGHSFYVDERGWSVPESLRVAAS